MGISVRGEPSQLSQLTFKYTRPDQSRFSNQGVFRNVPSENLALGSGRESENMEDWVPGYNYFCMVADPLYAFNFNWGDFAYPWSTGEFEPRPNAVITNFNCDANVQPYAEQVFDWQEGLSHVPRLRHCQPRYGGAGSQPVPVHGAVAAQQPRVRHVAVADAVHVVQLDSDAQHAVGRGVGAVPRGVGADGLGQWSRPAAGRVFRHSVRAVRQQPWRPLQQKVRASKRRAVLFVQKKKKKKKKKRRFFFLKKKKKKKKKKS